jgi:hypothetical protein
VPQPKFEYLPPNHTKAAAVHAPKLLHEKANSLVVGGSHKQRKVIHRQNAIPIGVEQRD